MSKAIADWTEDTFEREALRADGTTIVDFWAGCCAPCRALAPVLESLAGEYGGRVRFGKVDVDLERDLARRFSVRSIPCLIVVRGGKEVARSEGLCCRTELAGRLDYLLAD